MANIELNEVLNNFGDLNANGLSLSEGVFHQMQDF